MRQSIKVAFCGIVAALSTVLMFLTGLIPVATLAIPAIAGCLLIPVVVEAGVKWGVGVYAVTAALSFLLAPDREAALFYVLFFGYYPVLYAVLGRIKSKVLRYVAKLLVFNAAVIVEALISIYIMGIPIESISFLGQFTPVVLLLAANIVFIIYDFALDGLIFTYISRLHNRLSKVLKGK